MTKDDTPSPPALPRLPRRAADSHKGDFGRALMVGGSRGMSGAVAMAGIAALRSGAGLVTIAVPDVCLDTVASFEPSCMTAPLPSDGSGRLSQSARDEILELVRPASCVACGPGLGRSEGLTNLVGRLYQTVKQPMVVDADGLNALAARPAGLVAAGGPRIVTPHPGEFRSLVGDEPLPQEAWQDRAVALAATNNIVVVLKTHRTLITDGERTVHNTTGNPGMATGGSGDVLTGVITALVCQGLSPFDAAWLGVYVHGLAGDLAASELGEVSLMASDLLGTLPEALQRVVDRR